MNEGNILSEEEQVARAYEILRKHGRRGDSFDLGSFEEGGESKDLVTSLLSNPQQLISSLNLTSKQAENIGSIVAGSGAGLGYKFLSQHIGGELASAVGGFLGAYISKKVLGGK